MFCFFLLKLDNFVLIEWGLICKELKSYVRIYMIWDLCEKKIKGIKKMVILEYDEDRIGVVFCKLSLFLVINFIIYF